MGEKTEEIKKPEYSYVANALLDAYNTIARSRRYEQGVPLTLSPVDIQAYLMLNELPVEIDVFMSVIYMLDNDYIDECQKRLAKQRQDLKRKSK